MRIRYRWRFPAHTNVLIYDLVGAYFIKKALTGITGVRALEIRKVVYIHPRIVVKWGCLLARALVRSESRFRVNLKLLNEAAVIMVARPVFVVTFGENSERFGVLSQMIKDAEFIGIQNGLRGPTIEDINFSLSLTNCWCLGQDTVEKYRATQQKIETYEVVGSLKTALYINTPSKVTKPEFDLCFVSQFRVARFERTLPLLKEITEVSVRYALEYTRKKGLRFCIAGSAKENGFPSEYLFFKSLLSSEKLIFFPNDDNQFSSYRAIDRSRLAITNHSTAGFEALSRGKRVLFFNPSGDRYFDVPKIEQSELWRLSGADLTYLDFEERVDNILSMETSEWEKRSARYAEHFVAPVSKVNVVDRLRDRVIERKKEAI